MYFSELEPRSDSAYEPSNLEDMKIASYIVHGPEEQNGSIAWMSLRAYLLSLF